MNLFYISDIDGDKIVLPEEESRHCIRILRLRIDDSLSLVDGKGNLYHCRITVADHKHCEVNCIEKISDWGKRDFSIHIAISPTKNIERFEWFLEKVTEIGIYEITPLLCERSERKVIKPERLEKIIISAMKQSYKAYKPVLHPLTDFKRFVETHRSDIKAIAHCEEGFKQQLSEFYYRNENIAILIGPEGDFSPTEIQLALKHGYIPTTLGTSRLRTETAGIVACHTINLLNS